MNVQVALLLLLPLRSVLCTSNVEEALQYSDKNLDRIDDDLLKLAAIPSISSLPEHAKDIVAASTWLIDNLKSSGLEASPDLTTLRLFNCIIVHVSLLDCMPCCEVPLCRP